MLYKLSCMQKHLGNKFDTVIKMVKVNPVSSFEGVAGADSARVHWVLVHPPCVRVYVHIVLNARCTLNI